MSTGKPFHSITGFCTAMLFMGLQIPQEQVIPLPEHPRPDFRRIDWINLNGHWDFEFDPHGTGETRSWHRGTKDFLSEILVPFPWGSPLSGVGNTADIAWYSRDITVPGRWSGRRIFVVIGASDWHTKVWVDGQLAGEHRGGYTPFEFELTDLVRSGSTHKLIIRVGDTPNDSKLYGKQGYGPARGIWQTPYLEVRGDRFLQTVHFSPDIEQGKVGIEVQLDSAVESRSVLGVHIIRENGDTLSFEKTIKRKRSQVYMEAELPDARLWSLDDPFLYETYTVLRTEKAIPDTVITYFGMREIGVEQFPGTEFPYVALNGKPVYLQLALDQAYHPDGYYTFPSDDFIRQEIIRSKKIGLNGQRVHVKVPIPRKLYWADKLGMLIMSDVPNAWGEPDSLMRAETEHALRGMIHRDYNHPSVFSWVIFNETWGLHTKTDSGSVYTEQTREWVKDMVGLAKNLDPTRLVEDNSANREDHIVTDLNTWHAYLPGYAWEAHLDMVTDSTYVGSPWNFAAGYVQDAQPMFNSECGNVWGYEGSTGNVDWSWDYHIMLNQFRRNPEIAGWLYTEHHDVINEWNGYYTYDRGPKYTGLGDIAPGMELSDLHAAVYVSPGVDLCEEVRPGELVAVPLWLSVVDDRHRDQKLQLHSTLYGWDILGNKQYYSSGSRALEDTAWFSGELSPLVLRMPEKEGLAVLGLTVSTTAGIVLHRNFTSFRVTGAAVDSTEWISMGEDLLVRRFAPGSYSDAAWSLKQWKVLDGLKVNGAGTGFFEYHVQVPAGLDPSEVEGISLIMELSSKPLLGKDMDGQDKPEDFGYMLGRGFHDPGRNPNAYPMTDDRRNPSGVYISINGVEAGWKYLPDDPADHRGILSWHAQPEDRMLREAGTYGYLCTIQLPATAVRSVLETGQAVIRLRVDETLPGGIAVYGRSFGRYPVDPALVFKLSAE